MAVPTAIAGATATGTAVVLTIAVIGFGTAWAPGRSPSSYLEDPVPQGANETRFACTALGVLPPENQTHAGGGKVCG